MAKYQSGKGFWVLTGLQEIIKSRYNIRMIKTVPQELTGTPRKHSRPKSVLMHSGLWALVGDAASSAGISPNKFVREAVIQALNRIEDEQVS
jgi:hypothetical protein